jgi:CheY-like chemotaxis protein
MEMTNGQVLNVLLADDDPDDRMLFEDAVSGIDAQVTLNTVKDGEELIEFLSTTVLLPDMLFLDLNMPRKNGFECLAEIRANRNMQDVFISIYSTTASEKEIEETFRNGANMFINKPNTFSELKTMLSKMFTINRQEYFPSPDRTKFVLTPQGKL